MTAEFELFHLIVRTPKCHSAFLYFQLEANEGLCFYSTLEDSLGTSHRDIEIQGTKEFYPQVMKLLTGLQSELELKFIKNN